MIIMIKNKEWSKALILASHPIQTLHFVAFPAKFNNIWLSSWFFVGKPFLGAGRLLWGFPCQFPCSNLEHGKLWWAWCNVGELWWALHFTDRRWHSLPVLVGEPVQPWPRVMRSPESRLTPCLPAHSKLVNQSVPRQSALYLAFVDLHFQTMPSTQYSHNIHTIFTQYCTFRQCQAHNIHCIVNCQEC